jgi:ATP-binding cassette subfamily F protein 3
LGKECGRDGRGPSRWAAAVSAALLANCIERRRVDERLAFAALARHKAAIMLHVNDLTLRIAGRALYEKASIALPEGARVGFVGRNGSGKTTLFNAIAGEISPDDGSISLPKAARLGRVAQEAPGGPESLIEVVLAADRERAALMVERETASDAHRIAEIETRLVDIDAHSAESRAGSILHGLGFSSEAQKRPCSEFSGGWRMRVALAAVLFAEPDLLLLDEPTNYLDLEGTLWLYDYLSRYPRTALVISHDRELLNEAVDHILHLTDRKLTLYKGGYDEFERRRREQAALQAKSREKQIAERKHLQAFVDRFRAKASKARQAQSRVKRLEKMEPIAAVAEEVVLPFNLPTPERALAPPLMSFEGVKGGYGDRVVLHNIDTVLLPDDRIALLGSNGNGKSTFAKLLTGRLAPLAGEIRRSSKLKVAYFAQHQLDELDERGTPLSHVTERMPEAAESKRRAAVARMGFSGDTSEKPITALSGGEKARLLLGLATLEAPHLLVLDEPTNHLDIDARAALSEALNDYGGAVVLITHDRFLLDACADRLWLVAEGRVAPFDGDVEDYRRLVLSSGGGSRRGAARAKRAGERDYATGTFDGTSREARAPSPSRSESATKKVVASAEERMQRLAGLIAKIDAALADGTAFANEPQRAKLLAKQRRELETALARVEEEWLEASEASR